MHIYHHKQNTYINTICAYIYSYDSDCRINNFESESFKRFGSNIRTLPLFSFNWTLSVELYQG